MVDRSEETAELLQTMIRNACVNDGMADSGHEGRSVETLQAFFGAEGAVFEPHPGRRSVVYRVPGSDPAAPKLMLMGHLDVVPVTESGWSVDPFGGEIIDDFVWGRGSVDMLNLTAAMAVTFRSYLRGERNRPRGDLLYLGVADEEAGGGLGADWLLKNHPDVVGCDYLLTEVAFPPLRGGDGELVYPVKVGEKGPFWRNIRTSGSPSHGSQPYDTDNALVPASRAVAALAAAPMPVDITPEWEAFVRGLRFDPDTTAALLDADRIDGEIERLAETEPVFARYVHACTHMTFSPNVMRGGVKMNTVADEALVEVDVRALPGQDQTTADDHFRKVLGPDYDQVEIDAQRSEPANSSPASGPLWEAIGDAFESMTGSRRIVPAMTPATTDARFYRRRGVAAYGVAMFDEALDFSTFLSMFHGNDERVSVASLGLTVDLLDRIVERFDDHITRDT